MTNVLDDRRYELTIRDLSEGSTSITVTVSDGTSTRTAQATVLVVATQLPATGDDLTRNTALIAAALLGPESASVHSRDASGTPDLSAASTEHGAGDLFHQLRSDHRRHVDEVLRRIEFDDIGTDEWTRQ